ncbi:MAG: hypothetical protein ACRCS0_08035 [Albidovulum sp.]
MYLSAQCEPSQGIWRDIKTEDFYFIYRRMIKIHIFSNFQMKYQIIVDRDNLTPQVALEHIFYPRFTTRGICQRCGHADENNEASIKLAGDLSQVETDHTKRPPKCMLPPIEAALTRANHQF